MAKEKEIKINAAQEEEELTAEAGNSSVQSGNETETLVKDEHAGDTKEELKEELTDQEVLEARVAELEDKLLRAAAEFENYKKRLARQRDDLMQAITDLSLIDILDVVDNFERAFGQENSDTESFHNGMELIFNQLKELLNKKNVKPIEAIGQKFDPVLHDAMLRLASDDFKEGYVAMEMNKGYRIGNRVLRHSKVGVSTGKSKTEEENN